MKYMGMPMGMWALFAGSFKKQLSVVLGYDEAVAKEITDKAKPKYKEIITGLPEFEKADRFKMNIVNSVMLCAFILSMPERPQVEPLTKYYADAMMTGPMKWFCRKSGKSKFTPKDIAGMKATAALRAADRNPYSWNMEYYEYPDGSGYEARFDKCGICALMKEQGLYDLPAVTERVRERIQKAEQPSVTITFAVRKHKDHRRRRSQSCQHAYMLPLDARHQQHAAGDQHDRKRFVSQVRPHGRRDGLLHRL